MPARPLPADADVELAFYEKFFFSTGREPYPVQEQAFGRIFRGESVLVTVPTGTGKTLMAKAALYRALERGETAIYTTPLRALTEEKYRELCEDFGEERVGFATGDYKVNTGAPIQVVVAEILWNRIFGAPATIPADVVVMDEGHYFNDPERGYVWEQSIIGLHPASQLVILSATIGRADSFCHWIELTRRVPMALVEGHDRIVPLYHEYREAYIVEVVRDLFAAGDYPAILFVFGRELCFEKARLLKTCRRFTTDEERDRIAALADQILLAGGGAEELRPLLLHGIGIHHAGILPRYKQLVERLTMERLIKFVVSTETISAGINLPAKRVIFPELKKVIKKEPRLLSPAEYHQMAGRAGRPQFDTEGIAITLAPEEAVQEIRKEIKDQSRGGYNVDEEKIRRGIYTRLRTEAVRKQTVVWSPQLHHQLVQGLPAELTSRTRITAEQVLAIGLPDLAAEALPGEAAATPDSSAPPPYLKLDIKTVVDHLLLPERERREAHKRLAQVADNLRALGVVDEHGRQVSGQIIGKLPGIDGLFVYYVLMNTVLDYPGCRALVEYLVDHDVIHRLLSRKDDDKRREWVRNRMRERRAGGEIVGWEEVEEEYDRAFPRELAPIEVVHSQFCASIPHPEMHGGKVFKTVWATFEDEERGFVEFVDANRLGHEEGNLFTYLARIARVAKTLHEATTMDEFATLSERVRVKLAVVDERIVDSLLPRGGQRG